MTQARIQGRADRILATLKRAKARLDMDPRSPQAPKWIEQIKTLTPALKNLKQYGDTNIPMPPEGVSIDFTEADIKPKVAKWWPF